MYYLYPEKKSNDKDWVGMDINELDKSKLTDYEVSKDPNEWKFVERTFGLKYIPEPKKFDGPAPSGWIQPKSNLYTHNLLINFSLQIDYNNVFLLRFQTEEALKLPYFISRTKNHQQPVYLRIKIVRQVRDTVVKKIEGDIWQLQEDLKKYLTSKSKRYVVNIACCVDEMGGKLTFRGDHVNHIKNWMNEKGF